MQNNTFPTVFIGQNLIKLSEVDSTNSFLKRIMSKSEPLPEGTVIMAENQYQGKGQAGNTWHAEAGKNLTFSVLLRPVFLRPDQQFFLNIAVGTGILRALRSYCDDRLKLKWPNDIYYGHRKLGGVLIENTLSGSQIKAAIVGIGINVNQMTFGRELDTAAVSLQQITGKAIEQMDLLGKLSLTLEESYQSLAKGEFKALYHAYVKELYLYQEKAFYRQNGEIIEGTITGVSERGLLELETSHGKQYFDLKEIAFLKQEE